MCAIEVKICMGQCNNFMTIENINGAPSNVICHPSHAICQISPFQISPFKCQMSPLKRHLSNVTTAVIFQLSHVMFK